MRLDSARELKSSLIGRVLSGRLFPGAAAAREVSVAAASIALEGGRQASIALGITRNGRSSYHLAVRLQQRPLDSAGVVDAIQGHAKGEADVRYIGRVRPAARKAAAVHPWQQERHRPLLIGSSIGHTQVTAGTLGCFVRPAGKAGNTVWVLSNNHVLADENAAKKGDPIIQPAVFDGGKGAPDRCARLVKVVRLQLNKPNLVDAACAEVDDGIVTDLGQLKGLGTLTGLAAEEVEIGQPVRKIGRTTGLTHGHVTAIEVDNLVVDYGIGRVRFDNQIEIESTAAAPFSRGGDSGSLIIDAQSRGVALLFADSDHGGAAGHGRTFANPIGEVMKALRIELALSDSPP
jgi:hypothetical protein